MRANKFSHRTVYQMMEPAKRLLPPRSRLYRIVPMGIGTPFTASLTSFVCRLAKAHHITMNSLFEYILMPAFGNRYQLTDPKRRSSGSGLSTGFRGLAKSVNGLCSTALHWIQVIESLTMRHDLRFLTLIALSDVIHQRHLLRKYQAWCPECYEELRLNHQVIYSPIIWVLSAVEVCPRHLRRLVDRCPGCGKQSLPLANRTFPGYCARCTTWLGTEHEGQSDLMSESQMRWHVAVARNIGELIASIPSLERTPTRDGVARMFRGCIAQVNEGMPKFGKIIGKTKSSVWGWYHGTVRASLNEMLKLCYCLDISLVDFLLSSERLFSGLRVVRSLPDMYIFHPPRAVKRIDYSKVEATLHDVLHNNAPRSMREVGEIVGVHPRTFYVRFPTICYAISKRHAEYRQAQLEKGRQRLKDEVAEACIKLRAQRLYPPNRRIAAYLGKPPYLSQRDGSAIARTFRY
jgi:TniQ